jgi:hypothetical protein
MHIHNDILYIIIEYTTCNNIRLLNKQFKQYHDLTHLVNFDTVHTSLKDSPYFNHNYFKPERDHVDTYLLDQDDVYESMSGNYVINPESLLISRKIKMNILYHPSYYLNSYKFLRVCNKYDIKDYFDRIISGDLFTQFVNTISYNNKFSFPTHLQCDTNTTIYKKEYDAGNVKLDLIDDIRKSHKKIQDLVVDGNYINSCGSERKSAELYELMNFSNLLEWVPIFYDKNNHPILLNCNKKSKYYGRFALCMFYGVMGTTSMGADILTCSDLEGLNRESEHIDGYSLRTYFGNLKFFGDFS